MRFPPVRPVSRTELMPDRTCNPRLRMQGPVMRRMLHQEMLRAEGAEADGAGAEGRRRTKPLRAGGASSSRSPVHCPKPLNPVTKSILGGRTTLQASNRYSFERIPPKELNNIDCNLLSHCFQPRFERSPWFVYGRSTVYHTT